MSEDIKKFFNMENRTKYFSHALVYLFAVSVAIFVLMLLGTGPSDKNDKTGPGEQANPFAAISLEAKGALVWDVVNGRELYAKNADEPLPLASLTKLMTAVVSEEKLGDNQAIPITQESLKPQGDSQLLVGDIWRARDLRDFTLLTSSNDGAFALAAVAMASEDNDDTFVAAMNETAQKIGLTNSKFFNEHGLDIEESVNGGYGSAKDTVELFEYMLRNHPHLLEATRYKNLEIRSGVKVYDAENTNVIVDNIPNLIASKTGYTDLAGGNLIVAFDAGLEQPIIISVLGSTEEGRFVDVLKLTEAALKQISSGQ